jgi:preprotein translocase subunit SecD
LSQEIAELKSQLSQQEADSLLMKENLIKDQAMALTAQQEKFTELEAKFQKEKSDLEQEHQRTIEVLEKRLIQEGEELSERNVRDSTRY